MIRRLWKKADKIELELPLQPQHINASDKIAADRGLVALRYGPLVYNFEASDNPSMDGRELPILKNNSPLTAEWHPDFLHGVIVIKAQAANGSPLMAIPNYARNNRSGQSVVWVRDESSAASSIPQN